MLWNALLGVLLFSSLAFGQISEDEYGNSIFGDEADYYTDENYDDILNGDHDFFEENFFGSGGSGLGLELAKGTFIITIKMKFKMSLLTDTTPKFIKVSNEINSALTTYISEEMASIPDDFDIIVKSFEPSTDNRAKATRAVVDIEFKEYTQQSSEELREVMLRFSDSGRIGRNRVMEVSEVAEENDNEIFPTIEVTDLATPTMETFRALITFAKRFHSNLLDPSSRRFKREKKAIEEEINLYLLLGGSIDKDNIKDLDVEEFRSMPSRETGAVLALNLANISRKKLKRALRNLIGKTIQGRNIKAAEILDNEPSEPEITTTVEPTPDFTVSRGDAGEPDPPEETGEPVPPDAELPDHCPLVSAPEGGEMVCTKDNRIKSVCSFTCNPGKYLAGEESITCEDDGAWINAVPYCIGIVCTPHLDSKDLANGEVECTNHNRYNSVCSYSCLEGYQLNGPATVTCGENRDWSSSSPVCELIPIDCEVEWGEWSQCTNDERSRTKFITVYPVGTGEDCPELLSEYEICIDCQIAWGNWNECENGIRTREEYVTVETAGAGKACESLQKETQECVHCEIDFEEWGECSNGERIRNEYIRVPQAGAGEPCPTLSSQRERCVDCQLGWNDWSNCVDGKISRTQYILTEPIGAGRACDDFDTEEKDCADCQISFGDWSECSESGTRTRMEYISSPAIGAGKPCRSPNREVESCTNCILSWGDWSECSNGERSKTQYVLVAPDESGRSCPDFSTNVEVCIDCQLDWGEWSECAGGRRTRAQFISVEPVGAGKECESPKVKNEECVDCEVAWGEWSECSNFERTRIQYVTVKPIGAGAECPPLRSEFQDCYDCEVAWDDWSQCRDGKRSRFQIIVTNPIGSGEPCPQLLTEEEECVDCEVEWSEWDVCTDYEKTRIMLMTVAPVGAGLPCPVLKSEVSDCANCVIEWSEWSECLDGRRSRTEVVLESAENGGTPCPALRNETEVCVDCELTWGDWSDCMDGLRVRYQYISVEKEGAGAECPELKADSETCRPCEMEWEEFGQCVGGEMMRRQRIVTPAEGAGTPCPIPATERQDCADCVVEWGNWSECENNQRSRKQEIIVESSGTGASCLELQSETEECGVTPTPTSGDDASGDDVFGDDVLCRFTRNFLGYGGNPRMRDLLVLGDESGSIGWINFNKLKDNFKAIAKNVNGGTGAQGTQIAMMSFARWTRTQFGFDTFENSDDIVQAIDKAIFRGGHRSKIGQALSEANTWMFQQAEGMRSFPGYDDNISHEILIATDGCRTSKGYFLDKGLSAIKKRGIKLSVLGIDGIDHDPRCKETVRSMVDDENDLYQVGDWNDLDEFNRRVNEGGCRP